jgi:hypothetical protein
MIRNLKALLLASMALAALSAVSASAASATSFNSEATNTIIKGTGDGTGKTAHQVFDAAGGTVTCNDVHLTGTQTGTTATVITLTAEFTTCTFLGQAATVKMEACDFRFHASGDVDVHDDSGLSGNCKHHEQGIKITIPGCTVIVPEQTGLKSVKYHNITVGGKSAVTAEANVSGITYDSTGAACPKQPAGTYADGTFTTGNAIITGTDEATGAVTGVSHTP